MKAISDGEFIRVFKDLHKHLLIRGLKPAYMRLYNESPLPPVFSKDNSIPMTSTSNYHPQERIFATRLNVK